jgi:hypothetical protein
MATRRTRPPEPRGRPQLTRPTADVRAKLEERVSDGKDMFGRRFENPSLDARLLKGEHRKWTDYNAQLLRAVFSTEQPAEEYEQCPPIPEMSFDFVPSSPVDEVRRLHDVLGAELQWLESLLNRLDLYGAPTVPARGGFVAPGAALSALQVVGKILAEVRGDVLIVDPYMDLKVFTDFAPLAPACAAVRLLTDSHSTNPDTLRPGLERWQKQFGSSRPIEVRLSRPRALHDRLIFGDGSLVWSITQSLKDLATRSAASAQQLDPEFARMKVDFYEPIWTTSAPLV